MFSVFVPSDFSLKKAVAVDLAALPEDAVWIDLVKPTAGGGQGGREAGRDRGADPGGHAGDRDFQPALYRERRALHDGDADVPVRHRHAAHHGGDLHPRRPSPGDGALRQPKPFTLVENKLARSCSPGITGEMVLMELLDAVIDRCADILERVGADIDQVSATTSSSRRASAHGHAKQYSEILIAIGRKGDLTSKVRESLVSIGRVVTFLSAVMEGVKWSKDMREQLKTMQRDVASLTDHASYLSNKITFVLDAMLGVVNLEQNNIIKLFSVMAVVLMPPTLIASIYGMNFKVDAGAGMGARLSDGAVMMLAAAIVPYLLFRWKKWL